MVHVQSKLHNALFVRQTWAVPSMHKLAVEWFEFGCSSEFQPESKMGEDVWVSLKTCTWYQNHGFKIF